ncbi:NmrA family NAD(P)-binding protein [Nocardioides baculatus]|uniref:NmrA family NAD(P)-binding protein n=1 Tax=Nocardioides baculatus TaxID=2801337 RepID=A0ABS1L7N8_9ACTN|nr:NmrA family NAD(P)-binding protein [Nocardioides baculatus]MBL0747709.1 NmrA family NAD(P)-binding protein [Nocardioides baculatus]
MPQPTITVAGATGDLGSRITRSLVARGATVRALVRNDAGPEALQEVRELGAEPVVHDATDLWSTAEACRGTDCVVSALNGLRDVIVDRQSVLLDAAVAAGVPRFIPSDYSGDFTTTPPGDNRNLDLRREFMGRADRAPIQVTSILNGAFMDMLGAEMPIIQRRIRRVLYWQSADQLLDFTTKDDVADFTAEAALDPTTPRVLQVAGDTLSVRDLAGVLSRTTGERYRPLPVGTIRTLGLMISAIRTIAPEHGAVFPAWQGMQYTRDMFSGRVRLGSLDNDRYPDLRFTSVEDKFSRAASAAAAH